MTAQPAGPRQSHLAAVPATEDEREKALAELVAAATFHREQSAKHVEAAKAADSAIMKLHGKQGSTIKVGNLDVTWKGPSRSFDKQRFIQDYPREANDYLYETPDPVLDTSAIPPKLKEKYMKPGEGEGSIVIK